MPLRVEKNLSDVFLLNHFPPTGGWVGGLQDASRLLFASLGKKKITSTHEHSHCVRLKQSLERLSSFVDLLRIGLGFACILSSELHARFGAIYW